MLKNDDLKSDALNSDALNKGIHQKVGFVGVERSPDPQYVDIRFAILKPFEGQGLVTQASKQVIDYVVNHKQHTTIYGVAMTENHASKAVLHKLGMKPAPQADFYAGKNLAYYSITPNNERHHR